jgi:cyclopropane fatty-acyl-phospholipid synthase-like methyltransferase
MLYDSVNQPVLDQAPPSARRVLDIGCGVGTMGAIIRSRGGCSVTGITFDPAEAAIAGGKLDRVEVADMNSYEPSGLVHCHTTILG